MIMSKAKNVFQIILGTVLLAFITTSCNDTAETSKAASSDTTTLSTPPPAMPDTTHMDTATTRPVKTAN